MLKIWQKRGWLAFVGLVIAFLITHFAGLLELPVFADEAIYIRWSQLIIDDLPRYLFFSMNDGKTPLFFWLLTPFQLLFSDQLYAARFVSVMVGLAQMLVVMKITSFLTKNTKTIYMSGLFVMILPFWYFHHRMALTDGLMTLMISLSMMFLISELLVQKSLEKLSFQKIISLILAKQSLGNIILAGIFFGLSLYSKIPAILFAPGLFLLSFLVKQRTNNNVILAVSKVFVAISLGMLMFGLLKVVPSFTQLFGRGSDFLFPLSEILAGKWRETIISLPVYAGYFVKYMTPALILLMMSGLFAQKNKSIVHVFFWSGVIFVLPIAIMGKMVYARYLFPAVIFFTLASVFAIEDLFVWSKKVSENIIVKFFYISFLVLLMANTISISGIFMVESITNSSKIPFNTSDTVQYLTEWSSGHGLYETSLLIKQEAQDQTIAVATEGSFGTLPDGLTMYFHRQDVSNISIDGIGYPVIGVPEKFAQSARNYKKKWLVINSHRNNLNIDKSYMIAEYCRPFNAPCLQVWDITEIFEELVKN